MEDARSKALVERWQTNFEGPLLAPHHDNYKAACLPYGME